MEYMLDHPSYIPWNLSSSTKRTEHDDPRPVLATGDETAESNRESFLFRSTDTDRKIAHYMFNKPA